jgi:hypothetical protein
MRVAVTGTRKGPTIEQVMFFEGAARRIDRLHHGMCVGVDARMHQVAVSADVGEIVGHPGFPRGHPLRMADVTGFSTICRVEEPLDRNVRMVDSVDLVLAFPHGAEEQAGGGTWFTIRHARRVGVEVFVVRPDGGLLGDPVESPEWDSVARLETVGCACGELLTIGAHPTRAVGWMITRGWRPVEGPAWRCPSC